MDDAICAGTAALPTYTTAAACILTWCVDSWCVDLHNITSSTARQQGVACLCLTAAGLHSCCPAVLGNFDHCALLLLLLARPSLSSTTASAPGSFNSSSGGSSGGGVGSYLLSLDAEGWVGLWDCSSWVCLDMTRAAPLPPGCSPTLLLMVRGASPWGRGRGGGGKGQKEGV
jgi:hypothetical protein